MILTHKFMLHALTGAVAGTTGSILSDFAGMDAQTLEIAFYGALGGLTRWVGLREPFWDGVRLVVLAVLMAVGIGILSPELTERWFFDSPDHLARDPRTQWAGAYFIGLTATSIFAWAINRAASMAKKQEQDDDGET